MLWLVLCQDILLLSVSRHTHSGGLAARTNHSCEVKGCNTTAGAGSLKLDRCHLQDVHTCLGDVQMMVGMMELMRSNDMHDFDTDSSLGLLRQRQQVKMKRCLYMLLLAAQ